MENVRKVFLKHLEQTLDLGGLGNKDLFVDINNKLNIHPLGNPKDLAVRTFEILKEMFPQSDPKSWTLKFSQVDPVMVIQVFGDNPPEGHVVDELTTRVTTATLEFRALMNPPVWNIVAVDIETTGLSGWDYKEEIFRESKHLVLSVAVRVYDENFIPKAEPLEIIVHHSKDEIAKRIDPYVRDKMHGPSGLLDKVEASTTDNAKAEQMLVKYLRDAGVERHNMRKNINTIVCGNSIYTDMKFLDYWMGRFTNFLSYQLLDISSIQIMNRMTGKPVNTTVKKYAHTALADLEESVKEATEFHAFFKKGLPNNS